ncbi:hypothetical protein G7Y89_g13626 [Cudoniella acicularis]|uniref:Alkyl hydroperoxide reductase subunit C/ Thiol specific antioxidant domain-containing protein n=1 Tax=Cudoniella acicularis TaxID=354080 RepID=A0A8H4R6I8_9HELO|nr:hypothetical protein G7Y89_g13626 [Cudoniella acicularis]
MDSESPILEQFQTLLSTSEVLFVVFFRGHWCPFCMSYLSQLTTLNPSMVASKTTPLIITSEPQEHLPATRKSTGYTGEAIVDVENVLASEFKRRGWVDVAITEKKGYKFGMAQPAVLVLRGKGKGMGMGEGEVEVLEKWAIIPSAMNLHGAKDRPDLKQVWENVEASIKGQKRVHGTYSLKGFLSVMWGKIFG